MGAAESLLVFNGVICFVGELYAEAANVKAGVHSNTNVYIVPSKSDWTRPRHNTRLSKKESSKVIYLCKN